MRFFAVGCNLEKWMHFQFERIVGMTLFTFYIEFDFRYFIW